MHSAVTIHILHINVCIHTFILAIFIVFVQTCRRAGASVVKLGCNRQCVIIAVVAVNDSRIKKEKGLL